MHVLLTSTNAERRDRLREAFRVMGAVVDELNTLDAALTRLEAGQSAYDVVLVDVDAAITQAVTWCQSVRYTGYTNSIVLLSQDLDAHEASQLLFTVADDVIRLPKAPEEVVARVYARSRRNEQYKPPQFTWDNFTINTLTLSIFHNDERLPLSRTEFLILTLLIEMSPHIVTREQIAAHLWDVPDAVAANTIDAHIKNLRQKLEPYTDQQIETVRGVGYRCAVPALIPS